MVSRISRIAEMNFSGTLTSICSNSWRAILFKLADVKVGPTRYTWKKQLDTDPFVTPEILPQSRPKIENSNRHSSKPEIDFVKIPTTFSNTQAALLMPLEIFRQGALEGVEFEKGA